MIPATRLKHRDPDEAVIAANMSGVISYWNDAAARLFGFSKEEAVGRVMCELLATRFTVDLDELRHKILDSAQWIGETGYTRRNGSSLVALTQWGCERNGSGNPVGVVVRITDTTLHKKIAESAMLLRQSEQRFHFLFDQHPDGIFFFGLDQRLSTVNPALCAMTGYTDDELLDLPLAVLVAPQHLDEIRRRFAEAIVGKPQTFEFLCMRKDGSSLDASITMLPNLVDSRIVGLHGIVRNITQRKKNEQRIRYLATHDPLTGLPNRNMLDDRMQHAIDKARRFRTTVAVLFMDLNRFKVINDTLGHDKGDMLLCTIAERLRSAIRESDTVARLGGDEFVVVLEALNEPREMEKVADTILRLVREPMQLDGHLLAVTTSIGGSVFPLDGEDCSTLMKRADIAMYEAKKSGSGVFRRYRPEMDAKAAGRLMLENSLRQALSRHELVLHYQPRLDVMTNRIAGVEALVRWDHPQKGLIYPATFIALAEETGLIDAVGKWVLATASRQLKEWQDAGLPPIKMSVNVSAEQLKSGDMQETISRILKETGLDADCLDLEITESSLMQNLEASLETLKEIRGLGVSLSIDHFGTGYSSLSHLKQLPINRLKIDKAFVKDVPQDQDDASIVMAAIAMAHNMSLKVVAEGVTSFDQLRFLQQNQCDEIQGYLLCQPLPALEAESFFKTCALRGINYSWAH